MLADREPRTKSRTVSSRRPAVHGRRHADMSAPRILSGGGGRRVTLLMFTLCGLALSAQFTPYPARAQAPTVQAPRDNEELTRLHDQDQSDRTPPEGKAIDWTVVGPRDRARSKRVEEMYSQDLLQTATDYYHAALVLQHGDTADDFLLAHEFCVVAISKGKNDREARWLAASSEDRFLMNIGRPQRFGTQFRSDGDGPMRLYEVGPGVTDETRRLMGVHSLAEAKAHEAEMNRH